MAVWNYIRDNPANAMAYGIGILLLAAFLLMAARDLARLFLRRGQSGRGLGRAWAVARTSMAEARSMWAWGVPVVWFAGALGLMTLVRTYDEEMDWLGMHLRVLLYGQEFLLLVFMGILACFSLPREREKRTIITTGSKPLSRLELFAGKVAGLTVVAAGLLLIMGLLSWGYLTTMEHRMRTRAQQRYETAKADADNRGMPVLAPEWLKEIADQGQLKATNYVTASRGMQIAGAVDYRSNPPTRLLKGGSEERVYYRFPALWAPPGKQPLFYFSYDVIPSIPKDNPTPEDIQRALPSQINIRVLAERRFARGQADRSEVDLALRLYAGFFVASWQPEALDLFSELSASGTQSQDRGPVLVEVRCLTPGVYLRIDDTQEKKNPSVRVIGLDTRIRPEIMGPEFAPIMRGFEKRDKEQIEGPDIDRPWVPAEVASWHFTARDLQDVRIDPSDNTFTLSLYLDLDKAKNHALPTHAFIKAYNRDNQNALLNNIEVLEKQRTVVRLPAHLLKDASGNRDVSAELFVNLSCNTPGHWISLEQASARLEQPPSPFVLNLLKSELVILAEVVLLIVIATTASIRLGGWVAVLATMVFYLLGYLYPFIQEHLGAQFEGLLGASDVQKLQGSAIYQVAVVLQTGAMKLVYMVASLSPDFRIYDPAKFIIDSRNMPWQELFTTLGWSALYALPFVAIGYLLIRKQEIGN